MKVVKVASTADVASGATLLALADVSQILSGDLLTVGVGENAENVTADQVSASAGRRARRNAGSVTLKSPLKNSHAAGSKVTYKRKTTGPSPGPLTSFNIQKLVGACITAAPPNGVGCVTATYPVGAEYYGPMEFWDVGGVTNFDRLFAHVPTDPSNYYYDMPEFNGDITAWDTRSATSMKYMFKGAPLFNQAIGSWLTGAVRTMYSMFDGAVAFNQPLAKWDLSSVINVNYMFYKSAFNQPIASWKDMGSFALSSPKDRWSNWGGPTNVVQTINMFAQNVAFDQDLSAWEDLSTKGLQSRDKYCECDSTTDETYFFGTGEGIFASSKMYEAKDKWTYFEGSFADWNRGKWQQRGGPTCDDSKSPYCSNGACATDVTRSQCKFYPDPDDGSDTWGFYIDGGSANDWYMKQIFRGATKMEARGCAADGPISTCAAGAGPPPAPPPGGGSNCGSGHTCSHVVNGQVTTFCSATHMPCQHYVGNPAVYVPPCTFEQDRCTPQECSCTYTTGWIKEQLAYDGGICWVCRQV